MEEGNTARVVTKSSFNYMAMAPCQIVMKESSSTDTIKNLVNGSPDVVSTSGFTLPHESHSSYKQFCLSWLCHGNTHMTKAPGTADLVARVCIAMHTARGNISLCSIAIRGRWKTNKQTKIVLHSV